MNKQFLLNSILKEMKIIRRLSTKITSNNIDFRKKEGMRSNLELLQYLSQCGTGIILYWYRTDGSDFRTFYGALNEKTKSITLENFPAAMDDQIELITKLFDKITEEDLLRKEVDFPSGEKAMLAEGIIETSIKWLTAYKMQLFLALKLSTDEKLGTPDLWRKTEIEVA
jgi:hypothetical protein